MVRAERAQHSALHVAHLDVKVGSVTHYRTATATAAASSLQAAGCRRQAAGSRSSCWGARTWLTNGSNSLSNNYDFGSWGVIPRPRVKPLGEEFCC